MACWDPTAAGRPTTLRCALGLLRPDGGQAEVLGRPAARIHEVANRLGVVFDGSELVPRLTVKQNLAYAQRLAGQPSGRSLGEVIELVELDHRTHHRSHELSLGQQRRLAIGRALLGSPELLVLDEPLSGLDALGVSSVLKLLQELNAEGLTILLSTHRLHEMESVVRRAAVIVDGRLVAEGDLGRALGCWPPAPGPSGQ